MHKDKKRRKASKEAIKTVIPIYAKMVEIEKAKGVDDSAKYIKDFLASNNIAYDCLINNLQRSKKDNRKKDRANRY